MKFKKLILGMVMFAAMLLPSVSTTAAHEHNEVISIHDLTPIHDHADMGIMPRAPICACGSIMSPNGTSYSIWQNDHTVTCSHGYPFGTDMVQSRYARKKWKCSNCGRGYEENETIQFKTICHGYR